MNVFLKTLAIFVIAVTSLLPFPQKAQAQTPNSIQPPTALPDSLPIWPKQLMLDWVVTNSQCFTACEVTYTNKANPTTYDGYGTGGNYKWDTYASFNSYIATNAFAIFTQNKDGMLPTSGVTYNPYVYGDAGPWGRIITLFTMTNVGIVPEITYDSFASVQPSSGRVILKVPGLQYFSIETTNYSYTWTPTGARQNPPYPISSYEWTTNDTVVLSPYFSLPTNRVRFEIAVAGVTNKYTEYGEAIRTSLSMKSKSMLEAHVARGSDTCIVSSTDLLNWTTMTNILSAKTNVLFLPIDQTKRMLYFKVTSSS
jgi:hypothetical protein